MKNWAKCGCGSVALYQVKKYLLDYEIGDKVDIITDPSQHKRGLPHRRFHGRTGTVTGLRGRCFQIEVKLGNSKKTLIVGKEHIRLSHCTKKE